MLLSMQQLVCKHTDCSSLGSVCLYLECSSPVKFLDAFQSSQTSDSGSISTKMCTLPLQLTQHVGNVSSSIGLIPYACVSSLATLTIEFYSSESLGGQSRCELLAYKSSHLSPCNYLPSINCLQFVCTVFICIRQSASRVHTCMSETDGVMCACASSGCM